MSGAKTGPARILLVDDHPVLRQGLVAMIDREEDIVVCAEVETAEEALVAAGREKPDLAIVDLSLGNRPGLELIKDLHDRHPKVKVLVLSMHDETLWAERSLRAGACGYVMKQEKPRELIGKIRQALTGETCLSENMTRALLSKMMGNRGGGAVSPEETLGDRELEVLQLLGQGMSSREIADAMHISVKTVESHREHLKRKLGLGSGDELLRYAVHRFLGVRS